MRRFMMLTLIGTLGAVAIVVASNVIGEWLIVPWKYNNGSAIPAGVGLSVLYLGIIISLPARLLAFGSDSLLVSIAAAIVGFGLWGVAFAAIFQRLTRRSSGTRLRRTP
jgi:hypothetical protein